MNDDRLALKDGIYIYMMFIVNIVNDKYIYKEHIPIISCSFFYGEPAYERAAEFNQYDASSVICLPVKQRWFEF